MQPTSTQLRRFADVLAGDYETMEDGARAILEVAWSMYEDRARFVVVAATLYDPRQGGCIDTYEPQADKVVLGPYGTPGDAQKAAQGMKTDHRTGVMATAWPVPFRHETPAAYYQRRKAERERGGASEGGLPWDEQVAERHERLGRMLEAYKKHPGVLSLPKGWDDRKICYLCGSEPKEEDDQAL